MSGQWVVVSGQYILTWSIVDHEEGFEMKKIEVERSISVICGIGGFFPMHTNSTKKFNQRNTVSVNNESKLSRRPLG